MIAGGGTGGHLYPGIAVAEELTLRGEGHEVLFAGTNRGLEARVLPKAGFAFETVRSAGLVGAGPGGQLRSLGLQVLGFCDGARILRRFRPQVCLGVGGYSSFPVVALASLRGIPSAVQEQNAAPGLTNRVLSRMVRRVYAGDEAAVGLFPRRKVRFTGNPLRRALAVPIPYERPAADGKIRLLVLGGSQGSRALNEAVPPALAGLDAEVLHQAGKGKAEGVSVRYGGRPGARVVEFIDDMPDAYGWAQLVVCRAGALTVAELASAGRPAVLVPFPHAAGGHQEANARAVEARGAGVLLRESDLTPGTLERLVRSLQGEPGRLGAMAAAADRSARRDAARVIVDDLLRLAGAGAERAKG